MACSITQRESEAKETWRAMDEAGVEEFKTTTQLKDTDMGVKELVRDGANATKVRLCLLSAFA